MEHKSWPTRSSCVPARRLFASRRPGAIQRAWVSYHCVLGLGLATDPNNLIISSIATIVILRFRI